MSPLEKRKATMKVDHEMPFRVFDHLEFQLRGRVYGHPNVGEGSLGHTGVLLSIDFVNKTAESENTIWTLE